MGRGKGTFVVNLENEKEKKFKAWISSATKVRCIKLVYFQIRTRPTHLGTKAIVLIFGRVRLTILGTCFNSLLVVESTSYHFREIWKSGVPSKKVFGRSWHFGPITWVKSQYWAHIFLRWGGAVPYDTLLRLHSFSVSENSYEQQLKWKINNNDKKSIVNLNKGI